MFLYDDNSLLKQAIKGPGDLKVRGLPEDVLRRFQYAVARHAPETTARVLAPGEPLQVTA
ncbi:hypothetical protein [Ktedonobacter robiniae]|uniref:Uncharacterized protein n=1 Tax=Ktedonobacter robiniae TaxID=2778365 RepID=A0ABQ3V5I8_9CHLR|nr:hypothetical protein [Ktedonobacter robiniae]GHO60456.1 hypothetical protein KSB_89310 [Ktedonobacter robiniae]